MNATETQLRVSHLIRAQYPVLAIESAEAARVTNAVANIARDQNKLLVEWKMSTGLMAVVEKEPDAMKRNAQSRDPGVALAHVRDWKELNDERPALFLFHDLHEHMNVPMIKRLVRDIAADFQLLPYTMIMLSPQVALPTELEKEVEVLDWPLPDETELGRIVAQAEAELPDGIASDLNGSRASVVASLRGLTELEAANVLALAAITNGRLDDTALDFIGKQKAQIIRKSGTAEMMEPAEGNSVGGANVLKAYLAEAMQALTDETAREYGVDRPRGVVLAGPPGTGKTLSAKAVAGEHKLPLLYFNAGSQMTSKLGGSEANTRAFLKLCEAVAPCIVVLDEAEKSFGNSGGEQDGQTSERILGTWLTWMQESTAPVYLIATVNELNRLRPEFVRRFDDTFFVDLPDAEARREILDIHLRIRDRDPVDFDTDEIAVKTDGYQGDELRKVITTALRHGFADGKREITTDDLLIASREVTPISALMADRLDALRREAKNGRMKFAHVSTPVEQGTKASKRTLET